MNKCDTMTKDEKSLLLYIETCVVDQRGLLDARRLNAEDHENLPKFEADGLVHWGRVAWHDIERLSNLGAFHYWAELTDAGWALAHALRRERAERMTTRRTWKKTSEEPGYDAVVIDETSKDGKEATR